MESIKKYIAEFIGTGAIIVNKISNNAISNVGIALAFGLAITVMIYACGHISGAHFNPAVTIAFFACNKFPSNNVVQYIVSQLLGAISASLLLRFLLGNILYMGSTLPALPNKSTAMPVSFIMEFVFTFCLMFVIMSVATDSRAEGSFAGLAIGFTVFLGAIVAGPISGGSFNPARSVGPAVVSGYYEHLWLYIAAPILGAICASLSYKHLGNFANINIKAE